MDLRKVMENELKSIVVPVLRAAGFTGSLPHFRRLATERMELLTFQFDRHGGGFVIEAAWCEPDGVVTSWGKAIPATKVTAHDLHPNLRLRIKAKEGSGTDCWFRYDQGQTKDCAQSVLASLPKAEQWWASGGHT
ncbi:DUF4304 domain-containing protein [Rhodanobacter sp. Si-c]|uniref:DUF4304 domain-containing protein n=1 Tax=Rhodanobacter lycopersici TaxID=3162487 RepID=A0ABV3QCH9_9GAMM